MAQRLLTRWWRTAGPPDRFGIWLDQHLVMPSKTEARRYRIDGAPDEFLSWVESDQPSTDVAATPPTDATCEVFTFDLVRDAGVAPAQATRWLYVVHTDIPADVVDDYNAWYDHEHLPRLVAVPGIERARRYVAAADVSPRYLTAYDLSIKDAFESPQGLVARKTLWTAKMRSLFQNTRRKMCVLTS
jgi:hypothetical protein